MFIVHLFKGLDYYSSACVIHNTDVHQSLNFTIGKYYYIAVII